MLFLLADNAPGEASHRLGLHELADEVLDENRFRSRLQALAFRIEQRLIGWFHAKVEIGRIAKGMAMEAPVAAVDQFQPKVEFSLPVDAGLKGNRLPNSIAHAQIGEMDPIKINQLDQVVAKAREPNNLEIVRKPFISAL